MHNERRDDVTRTRGVVCSRFFRRVLSLGYVLHLAIIEFVHQICSLKHQWHDCVAESSVHIRGINTANFMSAILAIVGRQSDPCLTRVRVYIKALRISEPERGSTLT